MSVELYGNGMVSLRRTAIQPQEGTSLLDSVMATGEEALLASPVSSLLRNNELLNAELEGGKELTADEARRQIQDAGLQLTVPDQGVNQRYLDILIDRKQEEMRRARVLQDAPQGAGATATRFGAGFAASMLDPINIASAYVPVVGQARYMKWLGQAKNIGGRTAVRAGVGAVEGTVGAAMVEPIIASAKEREQADYDMNDSLANIAFGTVFGGGLHVIGGGGADLYRKIRGATNPWDLPELAAGREAHAAVYDDINSQLLGAGRAPDEAAANASLVASAFRSLSEVSGRPVDELYAEFGPKISFAREGEAAYAQGINLRQLEEALISGRTFNQAAYHGSPHDFDKFSLDKIGTGEGAQAYGWGLYFAENPAVAGDYAKRLSSKATTVNGIPLEQALETLPISEAAKKAIHYEFWNEPDFDKAMGRLMRGVDRGDEGAMEAYGFLKANKTVPSKGALYQVDIPDSATARMLDWDKPLSEQPESVRKAVMAVTGGKAKGLWTGEDIYRALSGNSRESVVAGLGSQDAASKALREAGIPGIRYLDQGSRSTFTVKKLPTTKEFGENGGKWAVYRDSAGINEYFDSKDAADAFVRQMERQNPPTRNIVVFDDSIVKITHKDGTPVTAKERKEFLQVTTKGMARGSIDMATGRRINITLFQKADRSTFLHETGHLFLEVMDSLAGRADAPEALKADLAKAREWMGLKDGEAIGEKHHEQFARGFEAYLREGRAPTPKLTKIFERFRDWLVSIYKDAKALNVTLSDDVRGVYDRLIAGYPAAKKVELAGPAKREAALKAAVAQAVSGNRVDVEGIINGDMAAVTRAAKNPEPSLQEPPPKPLEVVDDDTSIEAARESLMDIEATIKASGDEAVIRELDDMDEIVATAKLHGRIAKKLAPCIGATDG